MLVSPGLQGKLERLDQNHVLESLLRFQHYHAGQNWSFLEGESVAFL